MLTALPERFADFQYRFGGTPVFAKSLTPLTSIHTNAKS
jgi:hypothetical protein